ncbi:hypothetical protein CPB83DRAFT_840858 [Crepidotus variabilis]|uniref:Uncharacterized protein n=1 Tax=Crepidotus variabilis TaxID=179855 RepID=A0A9P6JIE0_9AGAR|nr:hypothetical protein CPB83DRAFT_840858 [Crepidotus variabilis]
MDSFAKNNQDAAGDSLPQRLISPRLKILPWTTTIFRQFRNLGSVVPENSDYAQLFRCVQAYENTLLSGLHEGPDHSKYSGQFLLGIDVIPATNQVPALIRPRPTCRPTELNNQEATAFFTLLTAYCTVDMIALVEQLSPPSLCNRGGSRSSLSSEPMCCHQVMDVQGILLKFRKTLERREKRAQIPGRNPVATIANSLEMTEVPVNCEIHYSK